MKKYNLLYVVLTVFGLCSSLSASGDLTPSGPFQNEVEGDAIPAPAHPPVETQDCSGGAL